MKLSSALISIISIREARSCTYNYGARQDSFDRLCGSLLWSTSVGTLVWNYRMMTLIVSSQLVYRVLYFVPRKRAQLRDHNKVLRMALGKPGTTLQLLHIKIPRQQLRCQNLCVYSFSDWGLSQRPKKQTNKNKTKQTKTKPTTTCVALYQPTQKLENWRSRQMSDSFIAGILPT